VLKCQAQLELTLMMCLGDRSTFTSTGVLSDHFTFTLTSAFNGRHDRSSPLFFLEDLLSSRGVCVCKSLKLSPPPIFSEIVEGLVGSPLWHHRGGGLICCKSFLPKGRGSTLVQSTIMGLFICFLTSIAQT